MILTIRKTDGFATSTGPLMHWMVDTYHNDMLPYAHLPLSEVYSLIKHLPFRPDPPDLETLMRPKYTMRMQGFGGDCDDKAIALASYAVLTLRPDPVTKRPYRFVAVRRANMPTLHHVYPELYIDNRWLHADPTYSFNTLGREREKYAEYVII